MSGSLGPIDFHRPPRYCPAWRLAVHWRTRSPRGGVWLYRWAVTTPWFFFGWRSRAYDRMFEGGGAR